MALMSIHRLRTIKEIEENRDKFLAALRSGKYTKGTIKSDDKGFPIVESEEDNNGYCACAVMIHEFPDEQGKENYKYARQSLNLTGQDCTYIQTKINDTELSFIEIADKIEKEIFKR